MPRTTEHAPLPALTPLPPGAAFAFACHPGVPCFTECCQQLELALSPYDVLRLKNALAIPSWEFLDRYACLGAAGNAAFPPVYLAMRPEDGRCPFVSSRGCLVYAHRPAACRLYPVGRGTIWSGGRIVRRHVLVHEPHCQGFTTAGRRRMDLAAWCADQELAPYERFEEQTARILQHERLRQGWRPTEKQLDTMLTALYNLDQFRIDWRTGRHGGPLPTADEDLLCLTLQWLEQTLFAR